MDTFIPTSWHCLQNSSSLKWLHSCGVPGEARRMCPHNTKIRSRNSPQPLSSSLPPFLLFTNLGIFPPPKYLLRKTKSEIDKDTHILILNPKMRSPTTTSSFSSTPGILPHTQNVIMVAPIIAVVIMGIITLSFSQWGSHILKVWWWSLDESSAGSEIGALKCQLLRCCATLASLLEQAITQHNNTPVPKKV